MLSRIFAPILGAVLLFAPGCDPCTDQHCPQQTADYPIPFCRISSNGVGCSATLIDRTDTAGLVITCQHCVGGQNFRCRFTNGLTVDGQLIAISPNHDLAAFRIPPVAVSPAKIGPYDTHGTYRAFGFGGANPSNQLYKIEGEVIASGMSYPGRPCCENINATAIGGDSGSGTLNRFDEFVGVLWGCNSQGALITMGQPITEFLRDLVARGLWDPSDNFTPGGQPVAQHEPLAASLCSGPAWENCRRTYCYPPTRIIQRELQPIYMGCPPGRNPVDPRDIAPKPPASNRIVTGNTALFAFAAAAGLIAAIILYFNADTN
jgi:hypothetical protein